MNLDILLETLTKLTIVQRPHLTLVNLPNPDQLSFIYVPVTIYMSPLADLLSYLFTW